MSKLLEAIKTDANFIKSHTLQPQWWKVLKVFIVLGFLVGYGLLFGVRRTVIFLAIFLFLSLLLHLLYRVNTNTWTESWLDFVVEERDGEIKGKSIGPHYYVAIVCNTILAVIVSQVWP